MHVLRTQTLRHADTVHRQARARTHTHTHTHTYTHTHTHIHTHTYTHTHSHTDRQTYTKTDRQTSQITHTHRRIHTHAYAQAYTHARQIQTDLSVCLLLSESSLLAQFFQHTTQFGKNKKTRNFNTHDKKTKLTHKHMVPHHEQVHTLQTWQTGQERFPTIEPLRQS